MNELAQQDINRQCALYELLCGEVITYILSPAELQKEKQRLEKRLALKRGSYFFNKI